MCLWQEYAPNPNLHWQDMLKIAEKLTVSLTRPANGKTKGLPNVLFPFDLGVVMTSDSPLIHPKGLPTPQRAMDKRFEVIWFNNTIEDRDIVACPPCTPCAAQWYLSGVRAEEEDMRHGTCGAHRTNLEAL